MMTRSLTSLMSRLLVIVLFLVAVVHANEESNVAEGEAFDDIEEEYEPVVALLFPGFIAVIGVVLYYVLSRTAPWLPYSAAIFVIGTIMGIATSRLYADHPNLLNESIYEYWTKIDGELLLVGFLPGLIFKDASSQNTYLFQVAFGQCLVFAFPMVLAGALLTALVAYYVFPYDWSFNLALTFGAILSATDPVAVAALLNEVGAPPRLKVHIAGESLLNDGAAIVFYTIFSSNFLLELGIPGLGQDFDIGSGIAKFFHMSAGGVAIGIFFGVGMLGVLLLLDRRLDREENVTEVALTIAMAYTCYFTAEIAWGASGIIAVLVLGVMTTAFGQAWINDFKLLEDFWSLVEWLLNTVLFAVGGLVWGSVISNGNDEIPELNFTTNDWGYLVLLYVLLMMIRLVVFMIFFPIVSRFGLKSDWKEMIFQSFGGLRGAVGIALALSLSEKVTSEVERTDSRFAIQTNQLFGFVGGIAFLTLCINGVLAGPCLKMLGLNNSTDIRSRMLECYRGHARQQAIEVLVRLLSEKRFQNMNFAVVRHHVPMLGDLTQDELNQAAKNFRKNDSSRHVELQGVKRYLGSSPSSSSLDKDRDSASDGRRGAPLYRQTKPDSVSTKTFAPKSKSTAHMRQAQVVSSMKLQELRHLFLELVRARIEHQITNGELADQEFVAYTLKHAVDIASDRVSRGDEIRDWEYVNISGIPVRKAIGKVLHRLNRSIGLGKVFHSVFREMSMLHPDEVMRRINVERCIAFIEAHESAQEIMKEQFMEDKGLERADEQVLAESQAQVKKAEKALSNFPPKEVGIIVSHKVSKIILYNVVDYIENLVESGLLRRQEAEKMLAEIQDNMTGVETCVASKHPNELEPQG